MLVLGTLAIASAVTNCHSVAKCPDLQDVEDLARYRDTIVGRFNGVDIDTLVSEPIDSLSPYLDDEDPFGGLHFLWRVYTTGGTVEDLVLENTISVRFINEGDLDGNSTDDWGYVNDWAMSTWRSYSSYTAVDGKWKRLTEPSSIWLEHLIEEDCPDSGRISVDEIAEPAGPGLIHLKYSTIIDDHMLLDTIVEPIKP